MGIDARMLVRYPRTKFKDDHNHGGLWDISCKAVAHFEPRLKEFGTAGFFMLDAMHSDGKRKDPMTAIQWSNARWPELGAMIGGDYDRWDGPPPTRATWDTVLAEVHLWTRYWCPDYPRGDLPFMCAVADWLEENTPVMGIIYGGDSSGVEPVVFDKAQRTTWLEQYRA